MMNNTTRDCPLCGEPVKRPALPDHIAREHGERPRGKRGGETNRPHRADGGVTRCPHCLRRVEHLPDHVHSEHGDKPPLKADGGATVAGPDASDRLGYFEALAIIQANAPEDEIGRGMAALSDALLSEDWSQAQDACRHLISYAMRRQQSASNRGGVAR